MNANTLVSAWESLTLPRDGWTHAAHLTVAAWYVHQDGVAALDRIRDGILRYNASVGIVSTPDYGYHETVTRFWVYRLAEFFRERPDLTDREAALAAAVAEFGIKRNWYADYWSIDILNSREARAEWVAPDLRAFVV